MCEIKITNESEVKDIYFKGITPVLPEDKIEKNTSKSKDLGPASRVEFALYSKDPDLEKRVTYTYFKINNPRDRVTIDIDKVNNLQELKTVIEWPKNVKQGGYPAENVEVGVKE